jgi:acid phosphatase type 7
MRRHIRLAVVTVATLAVVIGLLAPALAATLTFTAQADAFVNRSQASSNKGTSAELRIRNDVKRTYVRFNVALPSGETVTSATLRLFATTGPICAQGAEVLRSANDTWGETSITWNNQPGPTAPLDTTASWSPNGYVSFDVTSAVQTSGSVSFVVRHAPGCNVSSDAFFHSREASNDPQLVLETSSGPPPPPQCSDGIDNDGDGATDFPEDPGCTGETDNDETDAPPPAGDVVIAAAGDIACRPGDTTNPCHHQQTSDLIVGDPTISDVLTLGDNQYEVGALADFQASYDPTWGRFKSITHPSVGNHEYRTVNAQGYRSYFGLGSGPLWDSFDLGNWHIVTLDSNCRQVGCSATSAQGQFLRNDLQSDNHTCELLYWHHPRFSSSSTTVNSVRPLWDIAYSNGVDVILNGHEHNYERFAPQTPAGAADPVMGIRQFVVGTGGKSLHTLDARDPNSEVFNDETFGVLKMTLGAAGYTWQFVPDTTSGIFTDSGIGACH